MRSVYFELLSVFVVDRQEINLFSSFSFFPERGDFSLLAMTILLELTCQSTCRDLFEK